MKILFLFFTLALFSLVRAQTQHLFILDSLTNQPIADVEVQTLWGSLFSDDKGKIEYDVSLGSRIILNHLGYVRKNLVFFEKTDTIFLVRKPHQLIEIALQPNTHDEFVELGYYHTKKRYQNKWGFNTTGLVAVFIKAPPEKVRIDEILLRMKVKRAKKYCVYLFKPDKEGMPGKILYKRTILADSLKKEGVINIHDLFIKMPKNGVFVGLESLEPYNPKGSSMLFYYVENSNFNIGYTTRKEKEINPEGIWTPVQKIYGGAITPCFGLKVYQRN